MSLLKAGAGDRRLKIHERWDNLTPRLPAPLSGHLQHYNEHAAFPTNHNNPTKAAA